MQIGHRQNVRTIKKSTPQCAACPKNSGARAFPKKNNSYDGRRVHAAAGAPKVFFLHKKMKSRNKIDRKYTAKVNEFQANDNERKIARA